MNADPLSQKSWYLVYTKPRSEQLAKDNLERQGYSVYLPLIKTTRRRRGRYIDFVEAMFPCYQFIHLDCINDNWAPIRSTFGVSSMVRYGGIAAKVPDQLIAMLQENEDETGLHRLPEKRFKPGDRVRVIEGIMAGHEGIYEGKSSKDRVTILLDIVDKNNRVYITRHNLQLA